jgi:hypothetical protein
MKYELTQKDEYNEWNKNSKHDFYRWW